MAEIPFGSQCYSIVHEDGTENYYKTSPHANSDLNQGEHIQVRFNTSGSNSTVEILAPNLTSPLFCELIDMNSDNDGISSVLHGINKGYRKYASYNSQHNVLVFETWKDLHELKLLIEEDINNYPYNRGNENLISERMNLIRIKGWNMSANQNGQKISLPKFKELLSQSYPLSSDILISLIELDEDEGLNPVFVREVFVENYPLSYTVEQRILNSSLPNGIKNQIIDGNDNFLDAPNHTYNDFIAAFPGYKSLYEKLNDEEITKLESGMDPADPNFDDSPVFSSFERLIRNEKYEVWIEGRLYKLYEDCRAISVEENVDVAYDDLAVFNPDGTPNIPQLEEGPQGLSQQFMDDYIPNNVIIYNPMEYDPLGNVKDDPNYNTALQSYNIVAGCPISNYTYSLYTSSDLTVDFYNMTDFTNVNQTNTTFYNYWTFGDGTGSFQDNPVHTFSDYGFYTVRLTTFNSNCGCWHVHTYRIEVKPPELREGNPDCPIENVIIETGWNSDPLAAQVVVNPDLSAAVPPNTSVLNYHFAFFTQVGTLVHQEDRGVLDFIFFTFTQEGEYFVEVTATWDGGCVSISDQHLFTLNIPIENPDNCDKRDSKSETYETTYNNDKYKLKVSNLVRGTFGTEWWRVIQGEQKLYRKKNGQILFKQYNAYHQLNIKGEYYNRVNSVCLDGYLYERPTMTCTGEWFSWSNNSQIPFPNKFGIDTEGVEYEHRVYLGGTWLPNNPSTGFQYDCYNSGGYLLFNEVLKLGD